MKLEINLPDKQLTNPLTDEKVRALVIVLGVILLICAAVLVIKLFPKPKSAVLPASTEVETTAPQATEVPTEIPGVEVIEPTTTPEGMPEVTTSPIYQKEERRGVLEEQPTGEPTGSVNQSF